RSRFARWAGANTVHHRQLLDRWWNRAVEPLAEAEEDGQSVIDCGRLFRSNLAEYTPYPALVYRSQVIDQGKGLLCQAALARRRWRIEKSLTRSARNGYDANQWKALVPAYVWVAHDNAGS